MGPTWRSPSSPLHLPELEISSPSSTLSGSFACICAMNMLFICYLLTQLLHLTKLLERRKQLSMSLTEATAGSSEQHSLMNILQAWAVPFPHLSSPNSSFWINSFLTKHTVSAYIRVSHSICNHLFRCISSSHKVRSLRAETVLFIFVTKPNVSHWICTYFYWMSEWTMGKKNTPNEPSPTHHYF